MGGFGETILCSKDSPMVENEWLDTYTMKLPKFKSVENQYCSVSVHGGRNRCDSVKGCKRKCAGWATDPENPSQGAMCSGFRVSKHPNQKQANGFGETILCSMDSPMVKNEWLDTYQMKEPASQSVK